MSYASEGEHWDYKDIRRVRRVRDSRPVQLPRKDANMWTLGHGARFTMGDGSRVAVQGWCRTQAANRYWCVVYEGAAFPGEMRILTVEDGNLTLDGYRYRADGKRAHVDGSACKAYHSCNLCWEKAPQREAA